MEEKKKRERKVNLFNKNFGANIAKYRKLLDMSQQEFANIHKVHVITVSLWETGKSTVPTWRYDPIAKSLKITINTLTNIN